MGHRQSRPILLPISHWPVTPRCTEKFCEEPSQNYKYCICAQCLLNLHIFHIWCRLNFALQWYVIYLNPQDYFLMQVVPASLLFPRFFRYHLMVTLLVERRCHCSHFSFMSEHRRNQICKPENPRMTIFILGILSRSLPVHKDNLAKYSNLALKVYIQLLWTLQQLAKFICT
jgi:hypothetical protein